MGVEVGRVFLLCFLPKIRPGTSTDDCALWAATTQAVRRSRPWSKPCLGSMLLCPSLPPPTHRAELSGGPLPLPKHSGFPTGPPASPGSGSCGSVPTVHFPLGSPGNHRKRQLLTQTLLCPATSVVSVTEPGWLQGCGCAIGVLLVRLARTVPAVLSAELGGWELGPGQ